MLTTGGTGPAPRDVTPEATLAVGDREMPGFGEQMRQVSLKFVPTAILSRQVAVIRKQALIINLPGQPKAIRETLEGAKDAAGKTVVQRHLRRGALLHRPHRRPVHRDPRRGRQGLPAEVGAASEALMAELLDAIELETGRDPARERHLAARPRRRRQRLRADRAASSTSRRGPIRFVFPHAPMQPVTINNGYVDARVVRRRGRRPRPARGRARACAPRRASSRRSIARERERGVPAARIVLAGFSQGGAIALQTGLRHPERLAGIMALSTYVPIAATLEAERNAANRDVPIFMAHGTQDPVIPLAHARRSRELLERLGYPVEWHEYPMPHSVSPQEIDDIGAWLRRVLG